MANFASSHIQNGDTERISIVALDSTSSGVTGASVTLRIRNDANGDTWTGTTFSAPDTTVAMVETDSVNLPGFYHYDFTPDVSDIVCTISATSVTPAVVNDPWSGDIKVGLFLDSDLKVARQFVQNRIEIDGSGNYDVYADDGTTIIYTGDQSPTFRRPD